jgi:hypothetical protein
MKPRHVAVLALVGWYLLIPPIDKGGRVEASLPLDYWLNLDSFVTAAECRDAALQRQTEVEREPGNSEARIETYRGWRCIATDDPHLKGN